MACNRVNTCTIEEIKTLIRANNRMKKTITVFESNIKKTARPKITKGFLDAREKLVNEYWKQFQADHSLIMDNIDDDDSSDYVSNDVYQIAEDSVLNIHTWINENMNEIHPPPLEQSFAMANDRRSSISTETTSNMVDFRLPRFELPKFDGSYINWSAFHDLFKATVHDNKNIPTVQKLHFLKSCLTDEASHFLKHFQLTELNYNPAWEK